MSEAMTKQPVITLFFDNARIGQILDPQSFSELRFGGIQVQMAHLIKGLLKTGLYQIVVFSDKPFSYPGVEVRSPLNLIKKGAPIVSRWINSYRKKQAFHADTPRRIFMHSHIQNPALLDAADALGIETVMWINSDALVDGSSYFAPEYLKRFDSHLSKHDWVICQSGYQQEHLKARQDIDAPIVRTGVERNEVVRPKNTILWVGRCVASKQPWLFLDIARRLPECEYRMVLSTPQQADVEFAEVLNVLASDVSNLVIERNVPHADMAERYARALAFVSTSLFEGAPNVFAEAGMAGTPVFSLAVNPANMLDGEELGVYAEGDFEQMIEQLKDYLDAAPEEKVARQNRARRFAQSQWSIDDMVQSYRQVFEHDMVVRKEGMAK